MKRTSSCSTTACPRTMAGRSRTGWPKVLFLLLVLTLPTAVQSQFNYVTNDGAITITGSTGLGADVDIPSTIDGLPVTGIGDYAFKFSGLSSVTIPNSVTSIGQQAFYYCLYLTNVTIGNSVTIIGDYSFAFCTRLPNVTIPNSVTGIGANAFGWCGSLTDVTIPRSVTNIGGFAFAYCTSLRAITVDALNLSYRSVDGVLFNKSQTALVQYPEGKTGSYTIPNSVNSIGFGAFVRCRRLTNVTIPDSVTSVGHHAFVGCTSLTNATIPSSVTNIGQAAFSDCRSLISITVDVLNLFYRSVDGVLFNKSQSVLMQCPGGKAGSYTIPSSVTSIENEAFFNCTTLIEVTIGKSVTHIGNAAFSSCIRLAAVYFQGNAPIVGSEVFTFSDSAMIYFLPGTTGWGSTFGGRPTAQWLLPQPVILDFPPTFGVQSKGFGFTISWATHADLIVEASPDLDNPTWSPVGTNTLTDGSSYFSDPDWTNYPARFYRLRSP